MGPLGCVSRAVAALAPGLIIEPAWESPVDAAREPAQVAAASHRPLAPIASCARPSRILETAAAATRSCVAVQFLVHRLGHFGDTNAPVTGMWSMPPASG